MEFLGHIAFGLLACAFLVRDIFLLRCISIIANLAMIAYAYHKGVYLIIFWNVLFIVINLAQICITIYERRHIKFTDEEAEVFHSVFTGFSPVQFKKLIRLATWETAATGTTLVTQGDTQVGMMLLVDGNARVLIDGEQVAELKDGHFVGEMSFITNEEANATVVVDESAKYIRWEQGVIKPFLDRNPAIRFAVQSVIGGNLINKLQSRNKESKNQD